MHRIIIDTEDYSGNFERPMVAFTTGCIDDHSTMYEHVARNARSEMKFYDWWSKNIVAVADPQGEYEGATFVANIERKQDVF